MYYVLKFIAEEEASHLEKPSLQRTLLKDWYSHIRYNAGALAISFFIEAKGLSNLSKDREELGV